MDIKLVNFDEWKELLSGDVQKISTTTYFLNSKYHISEFMKDLYDGILENTYSMFIVNNNGVSNFQINFDDVYFIDDMFIFTHYNEIKNEDELNFTINHKDIKKVLVHFANGVYPQIEFHLH